MILEASDRYHIPEIKMIKAIHDAPTILERFNHSKQVFMAYYQSAFTPGPCKRIMWYITAWPGTFF